MSKSFVIEVGDNEVISAMNQLAQQAASPAGILKAIGDALLADATFRDGSLAFAGIGKS